MNLVSIVKYSIMELKNLFLYPLVEEYKITNYEKYWIDRQGSSANKSKNKDRTLIKITEEMPISIIYRKARFNSA